jgi:hypothetical protein
MWALKILNYSQENLMVLMVKKHKELQKTEKESIMDVQNLSNEVEERHNHSQE